MLYQLSYRGSASAGYSRIPRDGKRVFAACAPRERRATFASMRDPMAFPELLTPAEMSKADRFAIGAGTPGIALMERAGLAVADEAARLAKSRGRIAVLCGPGGNGGDGFVAARLLALRGYAVELGLLGLREALRGDPALAAARYEGPILDAAAVDVESADCVIDALFGAGLARDIDGEAKAIVERVNGFARAGGRVLAVDVPSGIDGETGKVRGAAVEASASVTFFRLKPGHLLQPGRALGGAIRLADIGIPEAALASIAPKAFVNAPAVWGEALPRPNAASHKYARGAVLVLSGAGHRTGAARLAARAALRAGAGIVAVASPPDAVAVNAAHLTAVMVAPFAHAREFEALLADERRRAIALGPGAGVGPTLRKLVAAALTRPAEKRTIVLDADALVSFAGEAPRLAALIQRGGHQAVLTPHEGEFARLFEGATDVKLEDDKLERARAAARLMGAVVLIKGADTVVAAPDGRATIGWDLPPWLATAGSGDVLSGLVAGLAAQEMPAFEAASAAVWLHGACGRAVGPGLIAEDLPEALPGVLRALG
jgi:ADP-dependent NAD(P)H-hydrate dehydratase / NAD(P)H-hydrate epimerase